MKLSPEEAWAGTLESMVDNRVVFYLKRYNRDYQDYSRQMKELCEKYPAIIQLIDGNNGVTYGTSATFGDCDRATAFGKRT